MASELRHRLSKEHDFALWHDLADMEGGKDWWQQIVEALSCVEYLVLIMTTAALRSAVVHKEWRLARQQGVCVLPILGSAECDLTVLPAWMQDVHFVDPNDVDQWRRFVRSLEAPCRATRVPFMADDPPVDFIARPTELGALVNHLVDVDREEPVAITAALRGAGGYGKTTLAKAVCHDERVQDAFHDGMLWVTLGEQPGDLIGRVEDLIYILSGHRPGFASPEAAASRLAELLADRAILIVLDDVWNLAHIKPFLLGGERCARLITTRNNDTLPSDTRQVPVDAMRNTEAVALLRDGLPEGAEDTLTKLAVRLGEWPLLLKLANGTLRMRVHDARQTLEEALRYVNKALDRRGLTAFDARDPQDRGQAVATTLGVSLELLSEEECARLEELGIFPEDAEIPLSVVERLWTVTADLDDFETEELCERLHRLSLLLSMDLTTRTIRLHDVVRTYLQHRTGDRLAELHARFLDGLGLQDWTELPRHEPYLWRNLAYHMVAAGRLESLESLVLDYRWLKAKLEATDVTALIADYEFLDNRRLPRIVGSSLRLSAHILARDRSELPGQLLARLSDLHPIGVGAGDRSSSTPSADAMNAEYPDRVASIQTLLGRVDEEQSAPWLRPLTRSLSAPGGPLHRTLVGHTGGVKAVAITPNGRRIVSADADGVLRVWDLETGTELLVLTGHEGAVNAVAITSDSQRVVSASEDATLRVWDLRSGQEVCNFIGHEQEVRAVAVTPDGEKAVSAADDDTMRVWNLTNGKEVGRETWPGGSARSVAVSHDGQSAVFASFRGTLKVWDLAEVRLTTTLGIQHGGITSVAMSPDGNHVLCAARDRTIQLVELTSGRRVKRFRGHKRVIRAVAITNDGEHAISASDDQSIKIWSLRTGTDLATLSGHDRGVTALAVTPAGQHVVSACDDHSIRIWNLNAERSRDSSVVHGGAITAIALTADGRIGLTGSRDRSLKLWDIEQGRLEKTFAHQHDQEIDALALTPDGNLAAASGQGVMRVWDIEQGGDPMLLDRPRDHWLHDRTRQLTISPDGCHVVEISTFGETTLWDLRETEPDGPISIKGTVVAVSGDGSRIMSRDGKGNLSLWDVSQLRVSEQGQDKPDRIIDLDKLDDPIQSVSWRDAWQSLPGHELLAMTFDGHSMLFRGDNGALRIWRLCRPEEVRTLSAHEQQINQVATDREGRHAASGSDDRTLKLWDLHREATIAGFTTENAVTAVAMSADARIMFAGDALGRVHFLRFEHR
ncbi:MAG: TIR domain-containing protein [Gammaproteobacteria bacterium]|nr:TIR domain-containing protein [Gammaproteobacteria bacterium]